MVDKARGAEATTLRIESRILTRRGVHVLLDSHLAEMYQVETKTLNRAVQRNIHRFPAAFCFQLSAEEWADLRTRLDPSNSSEVLRFQSGTLKSPGRGRHGIVRPAAARQTPRFHQRHHFHTQNQPPTRPGSRKAQRPIPANCDPSPRRLPRPVPYHRQAGPLPPRSLHERPRKTMLRILQTRLPGTGNPLPPSRNPVP